MNLLVIPTLYIDDQSLPPSHLCERCGGECYAPGGLCLRCERRSP